MLEAAKQALAYREALKHARRRTVRPWDPDPSKRRVLVLLPTDEDEARAAWRFVQSLGVAPRLITPVVPDVAVTYVPVEQIGRVHRLEGKGLGMLALPKKEFAAAVWADPPDVAFCLIREPDPAALYLVGASSAAFRAGFHGARAEPFFDLMVSGGESFAASLASLRSALARIRPPVLPMDGPGGS
jgi:hypothetical protein